MRTRPGVVRSMSLRIAVAGVVLGLAGFAVAAPPAKKTGERPPAVTVKRSVMS